tara:strand:- start:20871 stop:22472 length:1602 start_codon:yes stop_codon:yes gene_type:complete
MITRESKNDNFKKVCIPTAGIGSRLGDFTVDINKSLIDIDNKAIISYIIEKFPKKTEFIIPLGFKGNLVKQYLKLAHPKIKFIFVNVKKFKGKGSGLGHSILCAKKYLNEPFIFISCDTLIRNKINLKKNNWVGYSDFGDPKKYRGIKVNKGNVHFFLEKNFKKKKDNKIYIGIAGIKNYKTFWKLMENNKKKSIPSGEVFGLSNLQTRIKARKFKWLDAGNTVDYLKIKKKIKSKKNILEKGGEKIWFVENKVIKYFKDKSLISKRVKRASILKKFVPKIIEHKKNMYSYRMEEGKVFSEVKSNKVFINLLSHIKRFHKTTHQVNKKKYDKICEIFYKKKTTQRIIDFEKKFKIKDSCASLNSVKTRKIRDILKLINWKDLVRGKYSNFHGDLHFENILYSRKNKKFIFLDWRQDFGGNLKYGDIYYDLAKLMHGLIVSHKQVQNNNYKINWRKKNINFSIKSEKIYKKYIFNYKKWILKNNFDLQRINILTGLIYLNIAALHHYPYSLFLYAAGKKILTDIVLYKKNDIEL